jgi:hypothetical protein
MSYVVIELFFSRRRISPPASAMTRDTTIKRVEKRIRCAT